MKYKFIAKTLSGFEGVLAEELTALGAQDVSMATRGVSFSGDKSLMYKVNYMSRLSMRILLSIHSFPVRNEKELYEEIYNIEWEKYMDSFGTLAIDAVTHHTQMSHSLFVAQLSKDAIVDRFRKQEGHRPSVNLMTPDLRIHIHLDKNTASIALDSSDVPLFKRGYRVGALEAPINEVLAAGLINYTRWNGECPLFDPMCGSGTFLIEAMMKVTNTPAGMFRPVFGFMKWKDFDNMLWESIKKEANSLIIPANTSVQGSDISRKAITMARRNISHAGFSENIGLNIQDFFARKDNFSGIVITNPPYDERMKIADVATFYQSIGSTFKHICTDSEVWIILSDPAAMNAIALHPSRKIKVFNGSIECRFLKYSIYSGSKKNKQEISS